MEDFINLQGIFEQGYGFIAKKPMRDKELHCISKAIYSYICSFSGKGKDAFPSQELMSSDLCISKDTLTKYLKPLKDKGYITVRQNKENGKFSKNVYSVNIIPLPILSYTVSTDTETTVYGEVDSINNNFNNNKKHINNNKKDIYIDIFNYYKSKDNLIKHTVITIPMVKAIEKAMEQYNLDKDYCIRIIDRHSEKVEETKNNGKYSKRKRGLSELFGQKKKDSVDLILVDYLDENYKEELTIKLKSSDKKVVDKFKNLKFN